MKTEQEKNYYYTQVGRIVAPNQNHVAGVIKIKGDAGGETNWLNVSAYQLERIAEILAEYPNHN